VVKIPPGRPLPQDMPSGVSLPVLIDEDGVFEGAGAILDHLRELEALKDLWYKFQSDVCYCED
jgi:hypothetical protein